MRALLALAALVALAAPAAAQGVVQSSTSVLLSDLGGPVPPGVPIPMTVTVTYRTALGAVTAGPTRVVVEAAEVPPWANFTLEQTEFMFETDPATQDEQRAQTAATLLLAPTAPAYARGNLTVVAQAEANGNVAASPRGQSQIFVIPAFNATLRIDAPADVRIRGGLEHVVPFTVTNLGNARAIVDFALPSKPETAQVTVPPAATLGPGESAEREVRLRPAWIEGGEGILTIQATPRIQGRTVLDIEPTTHDVLVTTVAAVPGAGALLVAAALALVACGRRAA